MKKYISLLLAVTMLFVMCACGNGENNEQAKDEQKEGIYWGMTFTDARTYLEEELNIMFDFGSHRIGDYFFRQFTAADFNGMGEAQVFLYNGEDAENSSLDAVYVSLDKGADSANRDEFISFITEKYGEYSECIKKDFEQLTEDRYRLATEYYIWDTEDFYGVIVAERDKDTDEVCNVIFECAPDREAFNKYWSIDATSSVAVAIQ